MLTVPTNDSNEPALIVGLSGIGGMDSSGGGIPDVTVAPATVTFGSVPVGGKSTPLSVTVTNNGTAPLVLKALKLVGADSDQFVKPSDTCSKQVLAVNATCAVALRFKPSSSGPKTAALSIPSNDPDENPVTVTVSGSGTP
jgi:hypothetical protein